ncbi:lamin tail domain-containing protein [Herbidospora yilanensis]|uniref:lamin tail domain-containing protein n=1 Tax=Herbidospora yilanensis TaxID=354426 RepID=UPI0007C79830|nr:lamin tail domain-containing protein [Herbidospora yilanensis]
MTYTLLRGNFVIRYPDLPRQGPEPDGDTIKFLPDTPALIEALPRPSGTSPDLNRRGISVRLEAIDATVTADSLDETVIWPKLFRRLVPYFAAGFPDFDHFDTWLRVDPVHRDDTIWLIARRERGNLHDVVRASGDQIELTVWPEDFVIAPDPATGPITPPTAVTGDLLIVAALPDPAGADAGAGAEKITLLNVTPDPVGLDGWHLRDASGNRTGLSGTIEAGTVKVVNVGRLDNDGDSIMLVGPKDVVIDSVTYKKEQVRNGRTIAFGRG